jgi:NAD(P)-dependent dehydrogenase (short-subunit alcohol dehydrogenase family)
MVSEGQLHGKVAIVTGAGSRIGIGRAIALALVGAGARVAVLDIDGDAAQATAAEARALEGADAVCAIMADITKPGDAQRAVETTVRELGGLHILVNNAGISPTSGNEIPFWELPSEAWDRTIATNLSGAFYMAWAAVGHLRRQSWGRIIAITTSFDTMLRSAPYGPSKAGHEALVAVMARDLEGSGVTANVLVPGGATNTNMLPRGRDLTGLLQPESMQAPAVWLASSLSDGMNGRRIIAQFWDDSMPLDRRLEKAMRAVGWPELGRQAVSARD